jgi:predicted nucleic acid-binding Zn ribbon protein
MRRNPKMPIYEFECSDGHITEMIISRASIADGIMEHGPVCRTCGKPLIKRRTFPSRMAVSFKGDGWTGKGEKK